MPSERVYYHLTCTVTRNKPVFLNAEIDAAFKQLVAEIAHRKGWRLVELETMPTHVHLLLEKVPWQELSTLVGYLKGVTARRLLQRFDWLRGELDSYGLWARGYHYVCGIPKRHCQQYGPTSATSAAPAG